MNCCIAAILLCFKIKIANLFRNYLCSLILFGTVRPVLPLPAISTGLPTPLVLLPPSPTFTPSRTAVCSSSLTASLVMVFSAACSSSLRTPWAKAPTAVASFWPLPPSAVFKRRLLATLAAVSSHSTYFTMMFQ